MKEKKKYPAKMLWNAEEWSEDFAADFPKPDNETCNTIFEEARFRAANINKPGVKQNRFRFLHLRWFSYALWGSSISVLLLLCIWMNFGNRKSIPVKQLNVQKIFKEEEITLAATEVPQPVLIVEQYDIDFDEHFFDIKQQIVKQQLAYAADNILNNY